MKNKGILGSNETIGSDDDFFHPNDMALYLSKTGANTKATIRFNSLVQSPHSSSRWRIRAAAR
jgi:hypothetical protein